MSKKRGLVVSDIHCGSIFGMLPPDFLTSEGIIKPQNAGQKHLWKCWLHLLDLAAQANLDFIVVNGDVIDGTQRAQRGTELSLPLLVDQKEAAIATLLPLAPMAPLYFIQGTEYHDCKAGASVEEVAKSLNAVKYSGVGTGRYSRELLDLDVDGVICNFGHGISVATGFYRATPADREGIFSALAGKEGKAPKADLVYRSHAHYFVHVEHSSKHIVISPCWQLQTRYMRKNSVYRMVPDIGACFVEIDGEAKKNGGDPVCVKKQLYPLPDLKPTKLAPTE